MNVVLLEAILPHDSRKAVHIQWPKLQQNQLLYQVIPCSHFTNQAARHHCSSNAWECFSSIGFPSSGHSFCSSQQRPFLPVVEMPPRTCGPPTSFRRHPFLTWQSQKCRELNYATFATASKTTNTKLPFDCFVEPRPAPCGKGRVQMPHLRRQRGAEGTMP